MRKLIEGEEVMLTGMSAFHASCEKEFNPYYGLVVHDDAEDPEPNRTVQILWEDGVERLHPRNTLLAWRDEVPEGARRI